MVHPARFELTTCCSGGSRSIQMSYGCRSGVFGIILPEERLFNPGKEKDPAIFLILYGMFILSRKGNVFFLLPLFQEKRQQAAKHDRRNGGGRGLGRCQEKECPGWIFISAFLLLFSFVNFPLDIISHFLNYQS